MNRIDLKLIWLVIGAAGSLVAGFMLFWGAVNPSPSTEPPEISVPAAAASAEMQPLQIPPQQPHGVTPETAEARKAIEEKIASIPDIARFFDRLRQTLPDDYDTTLDALAKRRISGAADDPDLWLSEAVKTTRQTHGALAAKAEAPALDRVFDQQLTMLRALSGVDSRLCVDFLYGGASEGFFKFAADNRALVADSALSGIEAILDGRQKKISYGPPTDADFAQLEEALLAKGLMKPEIDALLDGKTPNPPLPDARMCQAGQTYLETLKTLPAPSRLRIYALAVELMVHS